MRRAFLALTIGLAAVLAGCSTTQAPKQASRKPAPNFALKDADGRTVQLSDYKGKVVLLNFWATWCAPCRLEIPWFVEFERKYKDRGFAVLGVSMDEGGWDEVKPFLAEAKVNYRVLLGDDKIAQDYNGIESLPTSFIIDREGGIASVHVGLVSKSKYEKDLSDLL